MATARVIGTYVLPQTFHKFHQFYPDANLDIKVGDSSEVLQIVVDEQVQLGSCDTQMEMRYICMTKKLFWWRIRNVHSPEPALLL